MSPRRNIPQDAITVHTYAEQERFVQAFADGTLNLLIMISDPGLGKTRTAKDVAGEDAAGSTAMPQRSESTANCRDTSISP